MAMPAAAPGAPAERRAGRAAAPTHASIAWARLARSRRALVAAVVLGLLALVAIFADVVASDVPVVSFGPRGARAFAHAGEGGMACDECVAVWPLLRASPVAPSVVGPLAPPSLAHPFGTDELGRDLAARLVHGARTALGLALGATLLSTVLGVVLGGLAGTFRGFWNDWLVRLVETVDTFPAIVVVALVRTIEERPSALSLVVAVAVVRWAEVARLVRAEVLRADAEEYAVAARALGATPLGVFRSHVLRNALGPVVVSASFGVAHVVLLEAAVSFLGIGAPASAPSWGETLAEAARHPGELRLLIVPALALVATVGASYLLADALRDATDPRTVRRRPERSHDAPFARATSRGS